MKPQCPGALGKGCYLCEPGPFDRASVAGIDVREVHLCPACGVEEGDEHTADCEEGDRAAIEHVNVDMNGARYRRTVRLTPLGAEPWDHAAGECS